MIVLGIIAAILIIIALIHVGVHVEYSEDGLLLALVAGPLRIQILPKKAKKKKKEKPKEKKPKKKKEKEKKPEPEKEAKEKKGGKLSLLLDLAKGAIEALGNFAHRLVIRDLTVRYTAAGDDPYKTALGFGRAYAGAGVLETMLRRNFRVKKMDYQFRTDFEADKPTVYLRAETTIAIGSIVHVAVCFAVYAIKAVIRSKKNSSVTETKQRKAEPENGKTSDQ